MWKQLQQDEKVNHAREDETFINMVDTSYGVSRKFTKRNTGRSLHHTDEYVLLGQTSLL